MSDARSFACRKLSKFCMFMPAALMPSLPVSVITEPNYPIMATPILLVCAPCARTSSGSAQIPDAGAQNDPHLEKRFGSPECCLELNDNSTPRMNRS